MEGDQNTYTSIRWVLADKKDAINSLVRKLQNKAQKLGIPEPMIKFTGNEKIFRLPAYMDGRLIPNIKVPVLKVEAVITGGIPKADGFNFIAKISHQKKDDGTGYANIVIAPNQGSQDLLQKNNANFHVCTPNCDHCKQPRARQTTFLVSPIEKPQKIMQVGSTCVDDFTGTKSLRQIMDAFDIHMSITNEAYWNEMDMEYVQNPRENISFPVESYIAIANNIIRKDGFVRAHEDENTKDKVLYAIRNPGKMTSEISQIVYQAFNDVHEGEDILTAKAIINWFKTQPQNNNYINNAQSLMSREFFELKTPTAAGILASTPAGYIKAMQQQALEQDLQNRNLVALNEPFGEPKERGGLKLSVTFIKEHINANYPYVEYNMVDDMMRKFKWHASWPGTDKLETGKTYTLNGTIKKHTEYDNLHYTHISRCSDIAPAEIDTPVPIFSEGALKRPFKESFCFGLTIYNEEEKIDGFSYIKVEREWREDRKVRRFSSHISLPVTHDFERIMISEMAEHTGVKRGAGETLCLTNKADKKFIAKAYEALSPFMIELKPTNDMIYIIDDAYSPYFEYDDPQKTGKPNATNAEINKRRPQIFLDQAQAHAHGRGMPTARITTLKIKGWNPILVDESIKMGSIRELETLKDMAGKNNYNAVAYMRKDGRTSKIEPLNWQAQKQAMMNEIVSMGPIHDDVEPLERKKKTGEKYATIVGVDNLEDIAFIQKVITRIETVNEFLEEKLMPEGFCKPPSGIVPLSATLRDDALIEVSTKLRLIMVTDPITSYYLEQMGADVIELNAGKSKFQHPSPDAVNLSIEGNIQVSIVEAVKGALDDPNRDFKRRVR